MIRYVLAVLLTVALLALSMPALDRAATLNSERQVDATLSDIDDKAADVVESEEVTPDGHPDPQRGVDLSLPQGTLTTEGVDHFALVPHENGSYTHARYVLKDGTTRERTIETMIVRDDPEDTQPIEISGSSDQSLTLSLLADETGTGVVVATYG